MEVPQKSLNEVNGDAELLKVIVTGDENRRAHKNTSNLSGCHRQSKQ